MKTSVVLGGVYQLNDVADSVRVIAFDRDVVMYDTWWSHAHAWGMARLSGRYSYYRLPREFFESQASYLRTASLTQAELDVHRPDLPFSFAQHEALSWYETWGSDSSVSEFQSKGLNTLGASAVYLLPFGPKDGQKPAVLVKAANGNSFSGTELLLRAYEAQEPHLGPERLTKGVGIHRSGIKGKVPTFYLWGSKSRLQSEAKHAV